MVEGLGIENSEVVTGRSIAREPKDLVDWSCWFQRGVWLSHLPEAMKETLSKQEIPIEDIKTNFSKSKDRLFISFVFLLKNYNIFKK